MLRVESLKSWEPVSNLGLRGVCALQSPDHFHRDARARSQLGNPESRALLLIIYYEYYHPCFHRLPIRDMPSDEAPNLTICR